MAEGQAQTHAGTILMAEGEKVSQKQTKRGEFSELTISSCLAEPIEANQRCDEECKKAYGELKNHMRRIWDLETEEEIRKLANTYYPAVRSHKQLEAEAALLRQLVQLPNGQYQTGLMWSGDHRPRSKLGRSQVGIPELGKENGERPNGKKGLPPGSRVLDT